MTNEDDLMPESEAFMLDGPVRGAPAAVDARSAESATAESTDTAPIPLSAAMLDAIRTWAADDRLWKSRSATEFNLCTFARVILKAHGETAGILGVEEARMVSLEDLRADIIRSAARGQGPTFIAAKLDILIAKATFAGVLPEGKP